MQLSRQHAFVALSPSAPLNLQAQILKAHQLSRFTVRSNCSEKIRSRSRLRHGTKALPAARMRPENGD